MKIDQEGAGYIHFPKNLDDEYFLQLKAERVKTKYVKGIPTREYVKTRTRNEALDCRVYALAALNIMGISVNMLAQRSAKSGVEDFDIDKAKPKRRQRKRKSANFVQGWR